MIGLGLSLNHAAMRGGVSLPYAEYDIALDFVGGSYRVGGASESDIANLPGYAALGTPVFGAGGVAMGAGDSIALNATADGDRDFYLMSVVTFDAPAAALGFVAALVQGAGSYHFGSVRAGDGTTAAYYYSAADGENTLGIASAGAERVAFITSWQSDVIQGFAAKDASTGTGSTFAPTSPLPAFGKLYVGNSAFGTGFSALGTIEFVGLRYGTFTDAELIAIAEAGR